MRSGQTLLFVYNCDRGNLSAIKDYSQRTVNEKAPDCRLLALISTPVGMKKSWKRFISDLEIPSRFLHKDEYEEEFGAILTPLPVVLLQTQKSRSLFISADELSRVQTVEDLITFVSQRLATLPG